MEQALAMVPSVQLWLDEIEKLSQAQEGCRAWRDAMFEQGHDLGGARVEGQVKNLRRLLYLLDEFQSREILIRNIARGWVDFPSIMGGREVLLCWEKGQEGILHWREVEDGRQVRKGA
jgi:hypothetical protein